MPSATDWVASLSPWPAEGFGLERMQALLDRLGRPRATLRRRARRGDEREVDRRAHDRGAAPRRGRRGGGLHLAARLRLGRASRDRRGRLRPSSPARACRRRRGRRDAVRDPHRRRAARLRRAGVRGGGARGRARRAARRDQRRRRPRRPADERRARAHGGARRDAPGDRDREAGDRRAGCDRRAAGRGVRRPGRGPPRGRRRARAKRGRGYLGRPVEADGRRAAARDGWRFAATRFATARTLLRPQPGCSNVSPSRTSTSSWPRSSTTRTRPASSRGLAPAGDTLVATRSSNDRALSASAVAEQGKELFSTAVAIDDPHEALAHARALGRPVLVTGSLYLLADLAEKTETAYDVALQ